MDIVPQRQTKRAPILVIVSHIVALIILYVLFATEEFFPQHIGYAAEVVPNQRIAIVGGGVGGLGAAWALSHFPQDYKVTMIEASHKLGGAAYTYYHKNGLFIEPGFAQYKRCPHLETWFNVLNVSSTINYRTLVGLFPRADDMEMKHSPPAELFSTATEFFANSSFPILRAEIDKLTNILEEFVRTKSEAELMTITLETFLIEHEFSPRFMYRYLPMCLNMYVASSSTILSMPIIFLYQMELKAQSCLGIGPGAAHHVTNGASTYVSKIESLLQERQTIIQLQSEVIAVKTFPKSTFQRGTVQLLVRHYKPPSIDGEDPTEVMEEWQEYDQVIFATYNPRIQQIFEHPQSEICTKDGMIDSIACRSVHQQLFNSNMDGTSLHSIVHEDATFLESKYSKLRDKDGMLSFRFL